MAFVIFGDSFSFPEGNASTNRVYTFAKGFIENGINVHIICFGNEYLEKHNGEVENIKYYHPFGQVERSSSIILRRWFKFRKYFKTYMLLRKINREDEITTINLHSYRLLVELFAFLIARIVKTKIILDRCEHPLQFYKENVFEQTIAKIKISIQTKLYDGMFCISQYLIDFYSESGFAREKLFLVPSTVDSGRFDRIFDPILPFEYILYCGSLTILKDGVNILIESFNRISEKYPDINLVLIGKGDTVEDEILIRDLVTKLNIDERVKFLGQLPRTVIPAYLCNAKVLALARPESIIAAAGFPSKLTEYLATGKPVVVTKVGEIPVYLTDRANAFLAKPNNIDDFTEKIDYVLGNYELACEVGKRGKDLTLTIFNYNFQSKRMISFIEMLTNPR